MTPPLPPPSGMSTTEVFQVIQADKRADGVDGLVGMEADAALGGAAGVVVLDAEALEGLVASRRPSGRGC